MRLHGAAFLTLLSVWLAAMIVPVMGVLAQETNPSVTDGLSKSNAPQAVQDDSMQINRIGLIDLDGVLRRSSGTETVRQLLDEQRLEFQREFTIREAALQESEKALQADRGKVPEAEFSKRLKAFEDEVAEVQRQIQYRRQALDQAFQEAQRNIRALALEIVKEIAAERKLDLVLTQESALIFLPTLNISDEVLTRLDKRTENARIEIKVNRND